MRRDRIMDLRLDPLTLQMADQCSALGVPHDIEMPGRDRILAGRRRSHDAAVCEPAVITLRKVPALPVLFVETPQPDSQQGGLQLVETAVQTLRVMYVFNRRAVIAQGPQPVRQRCVVRRHRAAVAKGAEVLRRIEAETGGVAERARAPAVIFGTMRLRGALDHLEPVIGGEGTDCRHLRRPAIKMDGDDGACVRGTRLGQSHGIEVIGVRSYIDRDRHGANRRYGKPGGDKGVGGNDHLVPRPDIVSRQDQPQGVQPVRHADGETRSAECRELALEGPRMKCPASRTSAKARSISARAACTRAEKSRKGIMTPSRVIRRRRGPGP